MDIAEFDKSAWRAYSTTMTTSTAAPTLSVTVALSDHKRSWTYQDKVWDRRSGSPRTVYRANRRSSELPSGHSIVYVSIAGETVLEQLESRHAHPHKALKPLIEAELRAQGYEFEKLRWSQKAGCSCPCSPGFIIRGGLRGLDFWATVTVR